MKTNFVVIGCGAVAQCTLPILVKELKVDPSQITVIDFVDNRHRVSDLIKNGLNYVIAHITKDNYKEILSKYLKSNDILIDLSVNLDTCALLQWCHDNDVRFVNSSVEVWDPYEDFSNKDPRDFTLYARQMAIQDMISKWKKQKSATAIVDHGANPGLVSHFVKQALEDIANKLILEKPNYSRIDDIKKSISEKNFAKLAMLLGVKTIHISERDSQITDNPKKVNEFVNTWSIDGLYEEGIAPAELGWGTHEKYVPEGAMFHEYGPKNQICLDSMGIDTWLRSWVPSGEIIGMLIRHGEAFGISDRLTYKDKDILYRPTVHYVYCVSDSTLSSLHELKMRQLEMQPNKRILNDEIIDGVDELGCLLMGHDFNAWWIGSVLDIYESRKLVPNQNATTVQVAISVAAAVKYLIAHPNEGLCLPDDLNHKEILDFAKPYLGKFVSTQTDWSPEKIKSTNISYKNSKINPEDKWQFKSFLV